jgi:hypothetical protein
MPLIVTINKTGSIKQTKHNDGIESLYKKCGFKKDTDFCLRHSWSVKVGEDMKKVNLYARNQGRAGGENKYDLPPPIDKELYYGTMCVALVDDDGNISEDFKVEGWKKVYEALFGGFEDIEHSSDESEEDELDDVPKKLKTTEGYLKDGFVVDGSGDSESELDDDDAEYVDELINKKLQDSSDESDAEGVDAKVDNLSECSEEPYDYSDEE